MKKAKLCNYVLFKKNLKFERYLYCNKYPRGRFFHTSLRNGTNILEIEMGRRKHIPRENRYWKNCAGYCVEDEKHFLLIFVQNTKRLEIIFLIIL